MMAHPPLFSPYACTSPAFPSTLTASPPPFALTPTPPSERSVSLGGGQSSRFDPADVSRPSSAASSTLNTPTSQSRGLSSPFRTPTVQSKRAYTPLNLGGSMGVPALG